ncbi:unnamed protein product [Ectocarpus sp. 12 AP-2014]
MSEMGEEEVCTMACAQTLDGYTPNPLYTAGACPDYMKMQCNADGSLWQKQWDMHQDRVKLYNSDRVFHASLGIPTQAVGYSSQHIPPWVRYKQPQYQQAQFPSLLPPTSSQVFSDMRVTHPERFRYHPR